MKNFSLIAVLLFIMTFALSNAPAFAGACCAAVVCCTPGAACCM